MSCHGVIVAQARAQPEGGLVRWRPLVVGLLRRKYGWQRRALELQARFQRLLRRPPGPGSVYLEIR